MKITKVEAIELRLPEQEVSGEKFSSAQDAVIVKIHTDEGIVGIGDSYSSPHVVKALIEAPLSGASASGLARLLIGMNPLDIRLINDMLQAKNLRLGRRGIICHAIAAIDIALWDIAGKYYNQPIYQLLGGAFQKKLRAYASILFGPDGKSTCEIGKRWINEGFTAVKFGWTPMGQSEKLDLELVEGGRRGVGDSNDLIIDAGCCWDTNTAIRRAQQFQDYDILFLEEPLNREDVEGYRKLTSASPIPIAAGEGEAGRFAHRHFIEESGIDIIQIDTENTGITDASRVADIAEDYGLKVVNHFYTNTIGLAACLHWLVSRKSAFILEYCVEETPIRQELTKQKLPVVDGYIAVPEGPGLGVDLDDEVIERYRVR
jgi:L-alanine-DL-glutamate epimerase-like enolase superfamily enzyme